MGPEREGLVAMANEEEEASQGLVAPAMGGLPNSTITAPTDNSGGGGSSGGGGGDVGGGGGVDVRGGGSDSGNVGSGGD